MTRITTAFLFQKTAIDIAQKQFEIAEIQKNIKKYKIERQKK